MGCSRSQLGQSLWWCFLLLLLTGCNGGGAEWFSDLILLILAGLLAAAAALLFAAVFGGGVVFISAVIATYTHIRPTPIMRGLATTVGVLLSLLGILLVVAGFTAPPKDNQGLDILRAAGPWLYAGVVALWLGVWNLLAALKLLRRLSNEVDEVDDAQSLAEHF